MTWLRRDPLYINVYITGMYLVFIYMLPFSMLAVLNAAIYRQ
ncbi:FMRFamide Receptor -part 2, partial [Frankliniella occidentalis]